MRIKPEIFESALEIWEGGVFIDGTYIKGKKANLYLFENAYFIVWFKNSHLFSVEKIDRETASKYFPKKVSLLKIVE